MHHIHGLRLILLSGTILVERDGQKKKIGKANERKGKVKRTKDEEVNG